MSRTLRKEANQRKPWWRKETKEMRRQTLRLARRLNKLLCRVDKDEFPQYKGTQGKLSH